MSIRVTFLFHSLLSMTSVLEFYNQNIEMAVVLGVLASALLLYRFKSWIDMEEVILIYVLLLFLGFLLKGFFAFFPMFYASWYFLSFHTSLTYCVVGKLHKKSLYHVVHLAFTYLMWLALICVAIAFLPDAFFVQDHLGLSRFYMFLFVTLMMLPFMVSVTLAYLKSYSSCVWKEKNMIRY